MSIYSAWWLAVVPLFFILAALSVRLLPNTRRVVRALHAATIGMFVFGLSLLGLHLSAGMVFDHAADPLGLFGAAPLHLLMLNLVLFMALVLIRFSYNYMQGEACYQRFFVWTLLTLAAVAFTVISNHLALLWLGWVAISLSLHKLLMLYPERPRAILAAHKKFILARAAEALLLTAFVLLYLRFGTANIALISESLLQTHASSEATLAWQEQLAAVLIALAAMIKCAQLPVHGWLIKVVEVPTPVSALLHAGVINMGGFMLILFAPLISLAASAQWLLLLVAGLSTVLAALIMTTRISIKVRLAWSTSAQMGLMLLQCALGLYELALLHLILHSAYKAHAFLSSGNAVLDHGKARLTAKTGFRPLPLVLASSWVAASITLVLYLSAYEGPLGIWVLLGFALTALLASEISSAQHVSARAATVPGIAKAAIMVTALAGLYAMLKAGFASLLGLPASVAVAAFSAADLWFAALVITVFSLSAALNHLADKPLVQKLSTQLFAGLYLDEWFTRTTLRLWSTQLPRLKDSEKAGFAEVNQTRI